MGRPAGRGARRSWPSPPPRGLWSLPRAPPTRWGCSPGPPPAGEAAGGWVGEETGFALLQRLIKCVDLPVWVQGGVGLHTAAACDAAGAAGAVLDSQLLLARESPLADDVRSRLATMDGSETACLGGSFGAAFRAYAQPGVPVVEEFRRLESGAGPPPPAPPAAAAPPAPPSDPPTPP